MTDEFPVSNLYIITASFMEKDGRIPKVRDGTVDDVRMGRLSFVPDQIVAKIPVQLGAGLNAYP